MEIARRPAMPSTEHSLAPPLWLSFGLKPEPRAVNRRLAGGARDCSKCIRGRCEGMRNAVIVTVYRGSGFRIAQIIDGPDFPSSCLGTKRKRP